MKRRTGLLLLALPRAALAFQTTATAFAYFSPQQSTSFPSSSIATKKNILSFPARRRHDVGRRIMPTKNNNDRRGPPIHPSTMAMLAETIEGDDGDATSPEDDVMEDDEEDDEFFVSPVQIAFLRKEANKRESNRRLYKYNLPSSSSSSSSSSPSVSIVDDDDHDDDHEDDDDDDYSSATTITTTTNSMEITIETIDHICNVLFAKHEIIEIRGIGKDDKKSVHYIANAIANTLEDAINKPVVVVDVKGHAVRYYCPWDDDDENEKDDKNNESRVGKRIELRTKYRPGQWTRKAKPIRDNRGQIVTDVNGNSIKEIPVE